MKAIHRDSHQDGLAIHGNSDYSMGVGQKDYDRLTILNKYYNPGSEQFLLRAGLSTGIQVAEFGCGQGHLLRFISDIVGKEGQVFGIDYSSEQLNIASEKIHGKSNVTLFCNSVTDVIRLKSKRQVVISSCCVNSATREIAAISHIRPIHQA